MDRRNFFFSLASFSALLSSAPSVTRAEAGDGAEPPGVTDEIRALEEHVRRHPEPFPWAEHNELRHLYGSFSERESMRHADIILAHSLMDGYVLNVLGEWQLEDDPGAALVNLLTRAERHPSCVHLRAACLMKAGDVCREHGQAADAEELYRSVIGLADADRAAAPGLKRYGMLARFRLGGGAPEAR